MNFHSEITPFKYWAIPVADFLRWVEGLLPSDKFDIFKNLFTFPVKTTELTATCYDKLSRVFDGRNPVFNYDFDGGELRDDWERYRKDVLKEPEVWHEKGWDMFKYAINSILVVDMPVTPNDGDRYATPYFYWLSMENVVDFEVNPMSGNMQWLMFRQKNDTLAVIDDHSYRIFIFKDNNLGDMLSESVHPLGYCPCRFFWTEPLSPENPDIKAHPLAKVLGELDWYLFFSISKKHLDMYGSYPIYSGYEEECDYRGKDDEYCSHGFLHDKNGHNLYNSDNTLMRCPKCGGKRLAGVGSYIEVPVPVEGQPDLRNPIQMLTADHQSLKYNVTEENRLKESIINSVVGIDNEVLTTQAVNEAQIQATFETKSAILNRIKKGFEEAQKFVDDTICRLRYGMMYKGSAINYGTEFYTLTAQEIRKRYKQAKEGGANESDLDNIQRQLIETEYRNDPITRARMLLLADIEPYRHLSVTEMSDLYERGIVTLEEMRIKTNFTDYVKRFERENIPITQFGSAIPYYKKVETIKQRLMDYATESVKNLKPKTTKNEEL